MKIKHFVNLFLICKPIKFWPLWDAFQKHNPNQRRHRSTFLTSLMAHFQSFEVLSTKCIWSSNLILIDIQLNCLVQVELISTLLSSTTFVWFTPLLEHQSPLLNDFEAFLEEFNATFGDLNKECISNIKIRSFCQGSCSNAVYGLNNWLAIFYGVKQHSQVNFSIGYEVM
jgi:hypothetical protein